MNTSPYSYNEILAIIDLCVGLERHVRLEPDFNCVRLLGKNFIEKILSMNHAERIVLIKQMVQML